MAEYIDREAALETLVRYRNAPHLQATNSISQGMRIAVNSCIELLENTGTVGERILRCRRGSREPAVRRRVSGEGGRMLWKFGKIYYEK